MMRDLPQNIRALPTESAVYVKSELAEQLASMVDQSIHNFLPKTASQIPANTSEDLLCHQVHLDLSREFPWVTAAHVCSVPALAESLAVACPGDHYPLLIGQLRGHLAVAESSFAVLLDMAVPNERSQDSLLVETLVRLHPLTLICFESYLEWKDQDSSDLTPLRWALEGAWVEILRLSYPRESEAPLKLPPKRVFLQRYLADLSSDPDPVDRALQLLSVHLSLR